MPTTTDINNYNINRDDNDNNLNSIYSVVTSSTPSIPCTEYYNTNRNDDDNDDDDEEVKQINLERFNDDCDDDNNPITTTTTSSITTCNDHYIYNDNTNNNVTRSTPSLITTTCNNKNDVYRDTGKSVTTSVISTLTSPRNDDNDTKLMPKLYIENCIYDNAAIPTIIPTRGNDYNDDNTDKDTTMSTFDFDYHDIDTLIDFGIDMGNTYNKDDDIDSFAYEEECVINVNDDWNVDDTIRNLDRDFRIIKEDEWNSYIDNCVHHNGDEASDYAVNNTNLLPIDGESIIMNGNSINYLQHDGQEFDDNECALVNDDNADGSDVSPRTHDGQEFEGNGFTFLVNDDNADGSNVSSRIQQHDKDNFNYDNADNEYHQPRPGRLRSRTFHPPIFMGRKCMQLFWLLLVMGSYKILQLFSSLLFASTMLKISQSMGSDKSFKALIFSLLITSSMFEIQDLQSMGSVKYHKAFDNPREYPSSPVCLNQPKGTSPCLLNAQREQISLSLTAFTKAPNLVVSLVSYFT